MGYIESTILINNCSQKLHIFLEIVSNLSGSTGSLFHDASICTRFRKWCLFWYDKIGMLGDNSGILW